MEIELGRCNAGPDNLQRQASSGQPKPFVLLVIRTLITAVRLLDDVLAFVAFQCSKCDYQIVLRKTTRFQIVINRATLECARVVNAGQVFCFLPHTCERTRIKRHVKMKMKKKNWKKHRDKNSAIRIVFLYTQCLCCSNDTWKIDDIINYILMMKVRLLPI